MVADPVKKQQEENAARAMRRKRLFIRAFFAVLGLSVAAVFAGIVFVLADVNLENLPRLSVREEAVETEIVTGTSWDAARS